MALAYSYMRFSSPDQKLRHSAERQVRKARQWAAEKGHTLDESLRDEGVSAFHGAHIFGEGSLGKFVAAVAIGQVEPGSYLLLESWDRFSRLGPWDTLPPLQTLINNGITVVTLIDNKEWNREAMRTNPMAIIESIFIMFRAWEESRTKSQRGKDRWEKRRGDAVEHGTPITGRAPGWVRLSDVDEDGVPFRDEKGNRCKRFVLRPERAADVRRIYEWTDEGKGQEWIARELNREGVPCWGNGKKVGTMWRRPHVKAIVTSRAPGGFYTPMSVSRDEKGKPSRKRIAGLEEIAGYFPAAVDEKLFTRVHAMHLARGPAMVVHRPERGALAGLCRCRDCGEGMTRVVKGRTPRAGKPRLVCSKAKMGKGCHYVSVVADDVLDGVLCEVGTLALDKPEGTAMRVKEERARDVLEMLDRQAGNLSAAIAATPGEASPPESLLADLRAVEERRDALRLEVAETRRRAEAADTDFVAGRLMELWEYQGAALEERREAAPRINALLRQLFDAIVVDAKHRNLSMVWKSGATSSIPF